MSYLPRMSKTYKEPQERTYDDTATEITFNSKPIASALPDDKAFNPQTVLKQYNYLPHPPPYLPGPSLIAEAEQNSMYLESRRQRSKEENVLRTNKQSGELSLEIIRTDVDLKSLKVESGVGTPTSSRKSSKSGKTTGKKVPLKANKSKEHEKLSVTPSDWTSTGIEPEVRNSKVVQESSASTEVFSKTHESTVKVSDSMEVKRNVKSSSKSIPVKSPASEAAPGSSSGWASEGVQCTPSSNVERLFIMPPSIHYLIKTLSFLVKELDKNDAEQCENPPKEMRKLLMQINEAINALINHKTSPNYALQVSLSDSIRLQKIYNDLENYINQVYGQSGKLGSLSEEKKNIYCRLIQKECELQILNEKLRDSDIQHPTIRVSDQMTRPPEVVLQNKNLENEQLQAEIEFNLQEMKQFQQNLAEKNWEIEKYKEEIAELKKKLIKFKSRIKK